MQRKVMALFAVSMSVFLSCESGKSVSNSNASPEKASTPVIDLSNGEVTTVALARQKFPQLALVHLQGEVRHFGYNLTTQPASSIDYKATVADAQVWIAEYPVTKNLNLRTDSSGAWDFYVLKRAQDTLQFSFEFEKDFYPAAVETAVYGAPLAQGWNVSRAKSNVFAVVNQDIEDIGTQFPDEIYFFYAKMQLEGQISKLIQAPYTIQNVAVLTVGKSWASLFSDSLPHGDPGAHTLISPATTSPLQGPIYFDEHVQPNAQYTATSVDGGVMYNNLAPGAYGITAVKAPYSYPTVRFTIEAGVRFYVASPPHSIQGSNSSLPGLN